MFFILKQPIQTFFQKTNISMKLDIEIFMHKCDVVTYFKHLQVNFLD